MRVSITGTAPQKLYTTDPEHSTEGIRECQELDNESCVKIDVDFDVLRAESDIILEGQVFRPREECEVNSS